jgi:hypothetical protein
MKIKGYDITCKWSIDKYSIQKGDFVRFYIKIHSQNDYKIKWKFSDGSCSEEKTPEHLFCLKHSNVPCEGFVWVKAKIYFKDETIKLKRKLLIIPKILGEIRAVPVQVYENEKVITILKGVIIMYPPQNPTPFQKCNKSATERMVKSKANCMNELIYIPEVEIKCTNVRESYKLINYGNYKFSSTCMINYLNSEGAINYFKCNYPEKYGKRPKLKTNYIYIPENVSLSSIQYILDTKINLELINISQDLLPEGTIIEWRIDNDKFFTTEIIFCHKFKKSGIHSVFVVILIPECPPIIIDQAVNVI